MTPGDSILPKPEWELFASLLAKGKSRVEAHEGAYGGNNSRSSGAMACRLLKNKEIRDRITFLSNGKLKYAAPRVPKSGKSSKFDLQSVIKTCQEVIETSESTPQKLKAIEVLNKLGVFDGETKGDKGRMDPASICAWLAQFAGAPAENLAKIPGGLKGMLKSLMELTGTTNADLIAELTDSKASENPMLAGTETPVATGETVKPDTNGAEPLDFEKEIDETVDDETLVETIKAPTEPEKPSEAMQERLAPALAVGEETDGFSPSPILANINTVLESNNKVFNQALDKLAEEDGRVEF